MKNPFNTFSVLFDGHTNYRQSDAREILPSSFGGRKTVFSLITTVTNDALGGAAYFCASPSSVRLDMKTGSNGSSLPEIVIPRGPANLGSSTV